MKPRGSGLSVLAARGNMLRRSLTPQISIFPQTVKLILVCPICTEGAEGERSATGLADRENWVRLPAAPPGVQRRDSINGNAPDL